MKIIIYVYKRGQWYKFIFSNLKKKKLNFVILNKQKFYNLIIFFKYQL